MGLPFKGVFSLSEILYNNVEKHNNSYVYNHD